MGRRIKRVLIALLLLAALAVLLWFGWQKLEERYVLWKGSLLPRNAETLDISGKKMRDPEAFLELPDLRQLDARNTRMTVEQYEWLTEKLPRCHILWDVPVGDTYYGQDAGRFSCRH